MQTVEDALEIASAQQRPHARRFAELSLRGGEAEYWPALISPQRKSIEARRELGREMLVGTMEAIERRSQAAALMTLKPLEISFDDCFGRRPATEFELCAVLQCLHRVSSRSVDLYLSWSVLCAYTPDERAALFTALWQFPKVDESLLRCAWIEEAESDAMASREALHSESSDSPQTIPVMQPLPASHITSPQVETDSDATRLPPLSSTIPSKCDYITLLMARHVRLSESKFASLRSFDGWEGRKALFLLAIESVKKDEPLLVKVEGSGRQQTFYFRNRSKGSTDAMHFPLLEKRVLLESKYGREKAMKRIREMEANS